MPAHLVSLPISLVSGLFLALTLTGCGESNPAEPEGPSFIEVQEQVLNKSCLGCHLGETAGGNLNLAKEVAYDNLVNVSSSEVPELMRVAPGSPDESYLFIKITGDARIAPGTSPMPIGAELSSEQINLVSEWIKSGAER